MVVFFSRRTESLDFLEQDALTKSYPHLIYVGIENRSGGTKHEDQEVTEATNHGRGFVLKVVTLNILLIPLSPHDCHCVQTGDKWKCFITDMSLSA